MPQSFIERIEHVLAPSRGISGQFLVDGAMPQSFIERIEHVLAPSKGISGQFLVDGAMPQSFCHRRFDQTRCSGRFFFFFFFSICFPQWSWRDERSDYITERNVLTIYNKQTNITFNFNLSSVLLLLTVQKISLAKRVGRHIGALG